MIVGPHIGLSIWNLSTDHYNSDQLADNWLKMEFHDHSPGRGVPIPTEGIADGAITAAKLAPGANAVQDGSITPKKFANLPAAKVYNSAVTSAANGVETTLTFDSERFDSNNVHDTITNSNRLTAQTAGIYLVTAAITLGNLDIVETLNDAADIYVSIYKNGTTNLIARDGFGFLTPSLTITAFTRLALSDWLQIRVFNSTGAAVDIAAGTTTNEGRHDFGMIWMAP
jgi:hypothetical protein